MKFTGKTTKVMSKVHGKTVTVLEYNSKSKIPYMECSRCGKPIKNKMYVVQDPETCVELEYLGSVCAKQI